MNAELYVRMDGLGHMQQLDRYIGYIRIYLGLGVALSLVLLCVHILSSRHQPK